MNHIFSKLNFGVISVFFLMQTTSCGTVLEESGTLERHAIIVNKAGKPYLPNEKPSNCIIDDSDTCEDSREWSTNEGKTYLTYDEYLDGLISSAKKHKKHFDKREGAKKKLLLFIHGGLNQREDSNERTTKLVKQIKEETQGEYYPIFVNWNSALLSSYGEHLISVRQGKTDRWAWITSPTYLATDLGRGLLRAPVVWWSLVGNDLISTPSNKDNWFFNFFDLARDERYAKGIADTLKKEPQDKNFSFWLGPQVPYSFWKDWVFGPISTVLTYPVKFASSPWVDALGKSAWENMLRRTDLLFHTENDFQVNLAQSVASGFKSFEASSTTCNALVSEQQGLVHRKASGALSIFLRKLTKIIQEDDPKKWSITLVGHSMGAIIVNHILRDFGTCLPIDNIVFMAAASTTNSYVDSVFPYMAMRQREVYQRDVDQGEERGLCQREQREGVKSATSMPKVYHLMLHDLAETSETNFWNLPPTGSLLVWIDNFLSTPKTPMDRTSGRFTNFMLSLHTTPEEIRPCISIKRFPGGGSSWGGVGDGIPKNHSDFSERFRFWRKECWEPPIGRTPIEKFDNEKMKNCFF